VFKLINYICIIKINKTMEEEIKGVFLQCKLTEQHELQELVVVKKFLGIKNNTELIRFLIKKEYENIR
jgi:hypothetical protein